MARLKTQKAVLTTEEVAKVSEQLQGLQRQRAVVMKSRIMQANRLQAVVAGELGYFAAMNEGDRKKKFTEAQAMINKIAAKDPETDGFRFSSIVRATLVGIDAFLVEQEGLEVKMVAAAKTLPVVGWVEQKDQTGFGIKSLAIVVGEAGDLGKYLNPAKLWRRMGCAPWTFEDKTLMGATWRAGKEGKLPASEWETFGYSPRRRSIAYLIGEGLMKQNFKRSNGEESSSNGETTVTWCGPYRRRYDEAKLAVKERHPDYLPQRCHLHGMLLATKLLLKRLWMRWNHGKSGYSVPYESR